MVQCVTSSVICSTSMEGRQSEGKGNDTNRSQIVTGSTGTQIEDWSHMSDDLKSQIAISKPPLRAEDISQRIHTIRGHRVMLDADLAELYGVTTGALNQAIKRKAERFPEDFMFRLSQEESDSLRSQSVILKPGRGKYRKFLLQVQAGGSSGRVGRLSAAAEAASAHHLFSHTHFIQY
jgi:hypothetical protein